MTNLNVLVLRAAGTNCDQETCFAFEQAGATARTVHVNRLIAEPKLLHDYQILVVPGGFSYGDDVAAGRILANQLIHHFRDMVREFIDADKLVLGICNGFQVLVKSGLLPGGNHNGNGLNTTITYNDSGKFEDRWVWLEPGTDKCVFITPGRRIYLPIAHGEGKVCFAEDTVLEQVKQQGQVAFRYVDRDGRFGDYPVNPNGSIDHIAGLCDATGRVMGLMPHPERFIHKTHHPRWTREPIEDPDGLTIFQNAVNYFT
ncbi:MAG: phosphoribosylformylglycinamidine synthase I [Sedimentisphaerales bacterium]|nr:phosphoribosylformylglycinamidine synthase I [Sedimentisphaerales bacterium]